jgi:hypothetical protein
MLGILSLKLLNYCAKQCTVKQTDKMGHIATLINYFRIETRCFDIVNNDREKTCWIYTYVLYYMAAGNKRFRERQY